MESLIIDKVLAVHLNHEIINALRYGASVFEVSQEILKLGARLSLLLEEQVLAQVLRYVEAVIDLHALNVFLLY